MSGPGALEPYLCTHTHTHIYLHVPLDVLFIHIDTYYAFMHRFVAIYICTYIYHSCIYIYIYIHIHIHIHIRMHRHVHIHIRILILILTYAVETLYIDTHTCMHARMTYEYKCKHKQYVYVCMYVCMYTYIYIIYASKHIY